MQKAISDTGTVRDGKVSFCAIIIHTLVVYTINMHTLVCHVNLMIFVFAVSVLYIYYTHNIMYIILFSYITYIISYYVYLSSSVTDKRQQGRTLAVVAVSFLYKYYARNSPLH